MSLKDAITELVWREAIRILPDTHVPGCELFLATGALRIHDRTQCPLPRAIEEFGGYLEVAGLKFGDPGYDWSIGAAKELADEYMSDLP